MIETTAKPVKARLWRFLSAGFLLLFPTFVIHPNHSHATSAQAMYEDPFDQASGGASLTRAAQGAVLFANPAQMPQGKKILKWIGSTQAVTAGKDSVDEARSLASGGGNSGSESSDTDFVDKVFDSPLHFGVSSLSSMILSNWGMGVFARFEADLSGKKHDETGLPEVRARAETYAGAIMGLAYDPLPWLSLGIAPKYIQVAEPDVSISVGDQSKIKEIRSNPSSLRAQATPGRGLGYDAGLLIFLQGTTFDTKIAFKVDDIGDTALTNSQNPREQMMHAGLGFTLHDSINALHLGIDYRDLTGASGQTAPMRFHTGARLTIYNVLGLAAGLYQGYPSFGFRLNLFLMQLGFTYYEREMGDYAGDDGRELYVVSLSLGY